ncbi:MAG: eCIS core domain-containing protein, partial [Chloroflexota bacterium]
MARSRGAGPEKSGPISMPRGKRGFSRLGREQAATMAARHPAFVQHLARRHTIQPPTLLALGRSPVRRGVPLISPITPLARRVWEDLLARYATETAGIEMLGSTLAANRELLSSLSLLASLRQRTRPMSGSPASASPPFEHAVSAGSPLPGQGLSSVSALSADGLSAGSPLANAAVPGLAASAAMSATLAPVQRAIAQAMGSAIDEGKTAGSGAGSVQAPQLTSGGPGRRRGANRAATLPSLGTLTEGTRFEPLAEAALPPEQSVPRLSRSLTGGPGSLIAAAMPFHALAAAHRQVDASRPHAAADRAVTAVYRSAAGVVPDTMLPLNDGAAPDTVGGSAMSFQALGAAHRQISASRRHAAADWAETVARSSAASAMLGTAMPVSADGTPSSEHGSPRSLSTLDAARRQIAVSRRKGAADSGVASYAADLSALLAAATVSTADRPVDSASTRARSSPRQAALRQIAGSAGQPLAPVVRRMMEMALGATFADVRVHTGTAAGGAAQALGAQAFTMGRDIYFAPGRFEPGVAGGIALLAHELTHTRQGTAVPLRKAAPGAPALEQGDLEP